jgi:ribosomal protein S12 methylthiotransferase accessory factor
MALEVTWRNHRIGMLDANFGPERKAQFDAVSHLYNRTLGPVTTVNLLRPDVADLPLYTSSCRHASVGELLADLTLKQGIADAVIIPGGGKGVDAKSAFIGGLGEIAERLLAVLHFSALQDRLELATYDDLLARGRRALSPDELPLFAPEQYASPGFPYQPFDERMLVRWIDGVELLTGELVAVPAQLVLLYYKHHPREARIAYPTTGGLAFHPEPRRAVLHGFLEVVERDAINLRWYARVAPPHVIVDLAALGNEWGPGWPVRWSTPHIPEVEIYINNADVNVPVFTTLAIDRSRARRSLLAGGGADYARIRALTQALFELGQSRTSLKYYRQIGFKDIRADSDVSEMTDFFDAAIYYGYSENLHRLDWYRQATETVRWEDVADQPFESSSDAYGQMLGWAREASLNPLIFDFSGACWPGVSVTKVFVPQLTQACLPSHPYLGHPRFYNLPAALGGRRLRFEELNTDPVPFP